MLTSNLGMMFFGKKCSFEGNSEKANANALRILHCLVDGSVSDAPDYGTSNWDTVLWKVYSIVMLYNCGCRIGPIVRTKKYTGRQFLAWKDNCMRSNGSPRIKCKIG